jgi:glycerol-3-phosphate cytidylyltransferase-like family protein
MAKKTIIQYPDEAKEKEELMVEGVLAPVVRTYDELNEFLVSVEGLTKVGTSGFFNPLHKNHISNIVSSKKIDEKLLVELGLPTKTHLTVVVNGDWSTKNKLNGEVFMTAESRADIVRAIKGVDLVFINDVHEPHQAELLSLGLFDVFTKGGDRDFDSLPEAEQEAILKTNTVWIGNVGYEKKEGTEAEVSSSRLRAVASGEVL